MDKIAFIGAGNMARAIIIGLVNSGIEAKKIIVANPSAEKRQLLAHEFGVHQTDDNSEAASFADVIILSVKPHFISDVCRQISQTITMTNKLFISVAAGRTVEQIQQALLNDEANHEGKTPKNIAVVRVMPNTPSQLGLGMSGLFASPEVNDTQKVMSEKIMTAVGKIIWLDSEAKINNIIAVAGSAPAYFFLFMEAMEQKAKSLGFTDKESRMLVEQTALGAAQMVVQSTDDISYLRDNVTSKGGTTFAALEQFRSDGLAKIVDNAMSAAITRAEAMAK